MKICILHRYPLNIIEGTNPSFPIFLKKTLALGHEVYLVTFKNQRGSFHNDKLRIKDIGISFNRRNSFDIYIKSLLFIILAPLKVFLLNKKEEFDIIYCDDSFPFYEIMVKLLTDKKVFIRRGDLMCAYILDKFGGLFKFFAALVFAVEHFTWRKVDGISVITERFKQYMLKYGAREDKISVIEDSLDFEKFEFSGSSVDLKTKYGITDEFIVMYHGIMLSIKGLEAFVRAVPLVVEHNKNVKFFMVGAGEELEKIKSLTQELKVDDHIIFTGWVKLNLL